MSNEAEPVEHEDRWILNLRGRSVTGVTAGHRHTLTLGGWEVVLETPARLSSGPARTNPGVALTPETQDVAAVLPPLGTKVVSAVAFKSGTLRMVFEDGTHLTCPADAACEAWQIAGPGGWRFTSLPGRDLAVGSASAPHENLHARSAEY
ncbi:DUF6188 family protein [Streptomyces sp. NPDC056367]|uniref:DUF6188 family protein n=1 Tax=Streptomyces sp. NPDC056367 TaxID=3345797 RepID=UPI0035DB3605